MIELFDTEEELIKEITDTAHNHDLYECNLLGLDTIELNAGLFRVSDDTLLRYARLFNRGCLKTKSQFSGNIKVSEDVSFMIRRLIDAGADMAMIDANEVWKRLNSVNLFVDHAHIMELECLRGSGSNLGQINPSISSPYVVLVAHCQILHVMIMHYVCTATFVYCHEPGFQ
ncbi:hypothetical protein QQ045_025728 [Rhodiola kirilowii]